MQAKLLTRFTSEANSCAEIYFGYRLLGQIQNYRPRARYHGENLIFPTRGNRFLRSPFCGYLPRHRYYSTANGYTSHIFKHCAQRKTPAHFRRPERHQTLNFHEFSKFWPHGSNLAAAKTFHHEFSGSSRAQNLNPHIKLWGWTKGKRKRSTGSRAELKKPTQNRE